MARVACYREWEPKQDKEVARCWDSVGCQECARDEGKRTAVVTGGGLSTGNLIKHKYIKNNRSHCYNYRKGGDRSCGVGLELEIPVRPQFSYTHTYHTRAVSIPPCSPVLMKIAVTQILTSNYHFPLKRTKAPWKNVWQIPKLGQGKHDLNLEHLVPKCKEVIKNKRQVKRTQKKMWGHSHWPNLGQFKHNIIIVIDYKSMNKIRSHKSCLMNHGLIKSLQSILSIKY